MNELSKMTKLADLKPYLPLNVAGVTIRVDDSVRGEAASGRQGGFLHLSNTPAIQELVQEYDPRDIAKLVEERIDLNYDPELREFEGSIEENILAGRGLRNPFHLLEQALVSGPTGDDMKGDPAPYDAALLDQAVDDLIDILRLRLGRQTLTPKFAIPCTPASVKQGLRVAHILDNSAAEPFFSDPGVKSTKKRAHLRSAFEMASKFAAPTDRLPLWPAVAFARGDRTTNDFDLMRDTPEARSRVVHEMKDRLISGQSFVLQILDGMFTQSLSEEIASANIPEIDIREPWLLADWFEQGRNIVTSYPKAKSIGTDESAWDQHFTPQLWYAVFRVYKALFPETVEIVFGFSDFPVVLGEGDVSKLQGISAEEGATFDMTVQVGEEQDIVPVDFIKLRVKTEDVLRRIFAGASGTAFRFGDIIVDGFKYVLDTEKDGPVQLGWSMRSGNWMTFLANSLGNWIKFIYIAKASRNEALRETYYRQFGVMPPRIKLRWLVVRGDDAGQVWEYVDQDDDSSIAETMANWFTLLGGSANAKKQETSDEFGRWMLGFAQLFTSENYPRGVSSGLRTLARVIWNERDEVVLDDPDTGEDMRPYLRLMNMVGRMSNIWGLWNRAQHPRAEEITALVQDMDYRDRILPPLTDKERELAGRAFALRLYRRGQLTNPASIDEAIRSFWTTDLAKFVQQRYDADTRLAGSYTPLPRTPNARDVWRK